MRKKDLLALQDKKLEDLRKMAISKKEEIKKALVNIAGGSEKNLKLAKVLKRDVAQILSLITEKEIAQRVQK